MLLMLLLSATWALADEKPGATPEDSLGGRFLPYNTNGVVIGVKLFGLTLTGKLRHSGLCEGDIVTKVDGAPVVTEMTVRSAFDNGKPKTIDVRRSDFSLTVIPGESPLCGQIPTDRVIHRSELNNTVSSSDAAVRDSRFVPYYRNAQVVGMRLSAIRPESLLDKMGLQVGDIVVTLNGAPINMKPGRITTAREIVDALCAGPVTIQIERLKTTYVYKVSLNE